MVSVHRRQELSAFQAQRVSRPLLPWERELIAILGCSEAEYQEFAQLAQSKAGTRPAAYDQVPDIRNEAIFWTVVINLVIGAALTAAAYLLTPKPSAPDQKGGGSRQLAGRSGTERFASTYGFESSQELAQYGDTLPIVWTRWTGTSGGILVSPRLVYSRIKSFGGQQAAKLNMVVSEGGVLPPDRAGIFVGNNSLTNTLSSEFAFWYSSSGKCTRANLLYGTQGSKSSGDPDGAENLFNLMGFPEGSFCGAYVPSNNTSFGIYEAIPNGLPLRTNWRVVSYLKDAEETSQQLAKWERRKIAGPNAGFPLMTGVGCGWPRRQGLIPSGGFSIGIDVNTATVGATITYAIRGQKLSRDNLGDDFTKEFTMEDMTNILDSECARSDSILQIGEMIQLGASIWKVTNRSLDVWDAGKTQLITLECIEIVGGPSFSIPPSAHIDSRDPVDQNKTVRLGEFLVENPFYPLSRTALGVVKNTRPCDQTEVCLKSQVWTRLNGICNFQTVPSGDRLQRLDDNNVAVTSGTQTLYDWRTSVFTIHYREVGATSWIFTEQHFCIRGTAPVDQYNFFKFRHPKKGTYEFRFVPVSSARAARFPDSKQYVWLQSGARALIGVSAPGGLTIETPGTQIGCRLVEDLTSMRKVTDNSTTTTPTPTPTPTTPLAKVASAFVQATSSYQGYMFDLLGYPAFNGQVKTTTVTVAFDPLTPAAVTVLTLVAVASNTVNADGRLRWAVNPTVTVTSSLCATGHVVGTRVTSTRVVNGNNLSGYFGPTSLTFEIKTINTATCVGVTPIVNDGLGTRIFESNTQISEVSYYGDLITRSCDSNPEHEIVAVNEIISSSATGVPSFDNMSTAALSVKSSRSFTSIDQVRLWIHTGTRASNSFPKLVEYLIDGLKDSVDPELLDRDSIARADSFCATNKLYFDGAIVDRANIRSYLTEIAPFFLCNFVIRNGRFAIEPALPLGGGSFPVTQLFTADNIIEGSLKLEFLGLSERKDFQANTIYRTANKNELFRTVSLRLRWADRPVSIPMETIDVTEFCTTRDHAVLATKYLMSIKRRVTHAINFQTAPEEANVQPGSLIKVALSQTINNTTSNGVISSTGQVTAALAPEDGDHEIVYYKPGMQDVDTAVLTVKDGQTDQAELFGSLYSEVSTNITTDEYMVDTVELGEDGLVSVTAVNYPVALMLSDIQGSAIVVEDY